MKKKRLFSLALAGALTLTLLPTAASAVTIPASYSANGITIKVTKLDSSLAFSEGAPDDGYLYYHRTDSATGAQTQGYYDPRTQSIYSTATQSIYGDYEDGLAPFSEVDIYTGDKLYGYRDRKGNVVIKPQFEAAYGFHDGRAAVRVDGKIGYIDTAGKLVIPAVYDTWALSNGVGQFSDGLAYVSEPGKHYVMGYFINTDGEKVLDSPIFDVEYYVDRGMFAPPEIVQGKAQCYFPMEPFVNGYALVKLQSYVSAETGEYLYLLSDEDSPLNAGYDFYEYGLMDKSGNITPLEPAMEELMFTDDSKLGETGMLDKLWLSYRAGLIPVRKNYKYALANPQGEIVVPYILDDIQDVFDSGVATVMVQEEVNGERESNHGVIDMQGNYIIPLSEKWSWISDFSDGCALARRTSYTDGTYGTYFLEVVGSGTTQPEPEPEPEPAADEPSSWAAEQVNAAIAAGIVPQSLQSKYTHTATRAEFCALAVELYETVKGSEIAERVSFTDTDDVNVEKMAALGVVSGVGNDKFNPDGALTREQAATMLARLANALGKHLAEQAPTFADNGSISSWAYDAVGQVQGAGIMDGTGNNMFAPQNSYTREQSILTAMRLFQLM